MLAIDQMVDMTVVDWDGDGLGDVVGVVAASRPWQNTLVVYISSGQGGIRTVLQHALRGPDAFRVETGDVNGDGRPDAVVLHGLLDSLEVVFGVGLGAPVDGGLYYTAADRALGVADLNRDGFADVVAADSRNVIFHINDGMGRLPPTQVLGMPTGAGSPTDIHFIDVDLDGDLDLVRTTEDGAGLALVVENPGTAPLGTTPFGLGTGGCFGSIALRPNGAPAVGNGTFAIATSSAPRNAFGIPGLSPTEDPGSDPFGLGALFHVGLGALAVYPAPSNSAGLASSSLPIPAQPSLRGLPVAAQGFWLEERTGYQCSPALSSLVTSRGLRLLIQ